MKTKAVVLVNVGTPKDTRVKSVRKYLTQFLNDRRVIDIPWLAQKILVNAIIVPFRAPKSAKLYERLWTDEGSPLLINALKVEQKLQEKLPEGYKVYTAMSYGEPNMKKVLEQIHSENVDEIILVPMYPQYASSTTGSVIDNFMKQVRKWQDIPQIRIVNQFYTHPGFIGAFAERIKSFDYQSYDHIIFSYHGLPNRQINKIHPAFTLENCDCSKQFSEKGKWCYRATCYQTTRLLAKALDLDEHQYSVTFQSRLSNNWLTPFTDETLIALAKEGKKKLLVASPAFVADCLETIVEIGYEYGILFKESGGEQLDMVPSLNDHPVWIDTLADLVERE